MSREVPMLFSGALVRAIREGRKTTTRRLFRDVFNRAEPSDRFSQKVPYRGGADGFSYHVKIPCDVGDTIWVRETFGNMARAGYEPVWFYRADNEPGDDELLRSDGLKWKPSIHMPRRAARIFLKVTAVRIERVADITDADAVAEGCASRAEFLDLWRDIYPTCPPEENYCWVIGFKRKAGAR